MFGSSKGNKYKESTQLKKRIFRIMFALVLAIGLSIMAAAPVGANGTDPFQAGGDRLVDLQNDDGGWDWPLDDGNPASSSPTNTIGPIGMGLAQAYLITNDVDQLAALGHVKLFLLAKSNNFSPSDG